MANATLVVMAAGMGSRFGGMKQLEPVGTSGEVILDYSVYDAKRAGFDKVVFIIKKSMEEDFRAIAGDRIAKHIDVAYAFQDVPAHRKKPYGTGDAILSAEGVIDSPFAVLNADDFYGYDAFLKVREGLNHKDEYCMVGYRLANTLSDNGSVARGVCSIENGYLTKVTEHLSITKDTDLDPDTVVSMNLWGLHPNLFPELKEQFKSFLATADITKDEFLLPVIIDNMVHQGKTAVKVYQTSAVWHGMTYREDKEKVAAAIRKMVEDGQYPKELWK